LVGRTTKGTKTFRTKITQDENLTISTALKKIYVELQRRKQDLIKWGQEASQQQRIKQKTKRRIG
jgi:hypothetical protein